MSSITSKAANAKFAFKDESFCVDGTLNKRREQLMQELVLATRTQESDKGDKRINASPVKDVQDRIDALEEQMREHLITIRFTAVNNGLWQKWIMQNPPRKGNNFDASMGYNTTSFFRHAAIQSSMSVEDHGTAEDGSDAVLEPIPESEWVLLEDIFTAGDWDRIDMTLITLNQKDGSRGVDFLRRGSRETDNSETTSDSPVTSA